MFIKRYLTVTRCTFGDLFLLGRHVEEVTFFNGGYILYEGGTFWVKMVHSWVRGWTMGWPGNFLTMVRVCRPVLQILILFRTKNCHFSHQFSDLASKIHNLSRDWPLDLNSNKKDFLKLIHFEFAYPFLSFSFGNEPINTFVQSCSFLENHTRFQTKMGKLFTRFQTKTAQKPYPMGLHIPIWRI